MSDRRFVLVNREGQEQDSTFPEDFDLEGAFLAWQCFRRMGIMLGEDPKKLARDLVDGITLGRYLRTDNRYQKNATGSR
jgi:hypothetical protein